MSPLVYLGGRGWKWRRKLRIAADRVYSNAIHPPGKPGRLIGAPPLIRVPPVRFLFMVGATCSPVIVISPRRADQ